MASPYSTIITSDFVRANADTSLNNVTVNDIEAGGLKITGVADVGSLTTAGTITAGDTAVAKFTTSGQIISQANTVNTYTHLGNFTIGNVRNQTNNDQGICHRNWIGWDRFALMQNAAGNTSVNGWDYVSLRLRWNTKLLIQSSDTTIYTRFKPNTNATLDLGALSNRWRNIYAWNPVIQTSDDRHKINERPINNALALLQQLKLYEYEKVKTMNGTDVTGTERGVLAQDVLNTELAYAVSGGGTEEIEHRDDDGNTTKETVEVAYSVKYNDLFVTAVQAVKELNAIAQSQRIEIDSLEARLTALETANF